MEEYSGHKRKVIREGYLRFIQLGRNPESLVPSKRVPKSHPYGKPSKELERELLLKFLENLILTLKKFIFS